MANQVRYYAFAKNSRGQFEQMLVIRERTPDGPMPTRQVSQEFTGVVYSSFEDAEDAVAALNREARAA